VYDTPPFPVCFSRTESPSHGLSPSMSFNPFYLPGMCSLPLLRSFPSKSQNLPLLRVELLRPPSASCCLSHLLKGSLSIPSSSAIHKKPKLS
jgi:hypothetical protein